MAHEPFVRHVDGAKKAVLFIHGFLGSPDHFKRLIPLVPDDVAIYNMLLDGHGGTVKDFALTSMSKWQRQVSEVTEDLIKRYGCVIIVAHSMGTFFAIDEAVKHPKNIRSLMLLQSALKIGVRPTAFANTFKAFFNVMPKDDYIGEAYANAHSVKLNKRVWEYIGWLPRYVELFVQSVKARQTFGMVDVPCRIFQSKRDELVSPKSVKHIPQKPNIKLTMLDKSRHFIYDEGEFALIKDVFRGYFEG